jgi:hypothetical protein
MKEPEPNYNQSRASMIYEPTQEESFDRQSFGRHHSRGGHQLSKSINPNASGANWLNHKWVDDYTKTRDVIKTYRSINFKTLL